MTKIKSILIIDDNEIDIYIHQKIIEASGLVERVQSFKNAIDALNYFKLIEEKNAYYRLFAPQIILLDLNMPIMDGFQFLNEFDKFKIFKQKPIDIFLLSSSTNPMDIENANNNKSCNGVVSKPLNNEKLIKIIKLHSDKSFDNKTKVIF